eukprot:UN03483
MENVSTRKGINTDTKLLGHNKKRTKVVQAIEITIANTWKNDFCFFVLLNGTELQHIG